MISVISFIVPLLSIFTYLPPTLFSHIFPNPKNQISFVVAQKSLLVCLLDGRSQSLTRHFFLVFFITSKKNNEKGEKKSDGFYSVILNKIILVNDILIFLFVVFFHFFHISSILSFFPPLRSSVLPLHYFRIFFPTRKIKYLSW